MTNDKRNRPMTTGKTHPGPWGSAGKLTPGVEKRQYRRENRPIESVGSDKNMTIEPVKLMKLNLSINNHSRSLPRCCSLRIQSPIYRESTSTPRTIGVEAA